MGNLSEIIQNLLHIQGLSASDLSQKTGIDKSLISRLLSNKTTNPQIETLSKIADCFDISIDQLIGRMPLTIGSAHGKVIHVKRFIAPIIPWEAAAIWKSIKDNYQPQENIDTDARFSSDAFALKINSTQFEPKFTDKTIIIIDPNVSPKCGDIVLTVTNKNFPFLYCFFDTDHIPFLKSLSSETISCLINNTFDILGTVVEAQYKCINDLC